MARSEKMVAVSASRLKYAREYYGLSLSDVSKHTKIKEEELKKFESAEDFPSYAKLEKLAELYNRPLLYFFFCSEPAEEKLLVSFRSVESQTGLTLNMQVRTMMEKADWYRLNLSELFPRDASPCFVALLEQGKVKTEAGLISWLRKELDLSLSKQKNNFSRADILLEYLRDKMFDIGIYIFKDSFKADDVSGLCLYDKDYPVILLNNKTTFTRQIFTIFHEVYHLFGRKEDVYYSKQGEEKACDRFASEFLVPEEDIRIRLQNVREFEDVELIESLAKEYTVSPAVIAYRLLSQGKISRSFYGTIHADGIRKMNSATSGGNFYYTRMSYLGRPYLRKVFFDYYAGKINVAAVGKYTGLKASHISKLSSNMFGGVYG